MAPQGHYAGPWRCMGTARQIAYQRWILQQFHEAASRDASPDDAVQYREAGLRRLYEIGDELQDRQPSQRTPIRVGRNLVYDEQKSGFVDNLIRTLRDPGDGDVDFISTLWRSPVKVADQWMWDSSACYFPPGEEEPVPNVLDLDPAHGPVDRPSAFEPQHRREYITATAREDVIDSDADTDDLSDGSDSSEDDVVIVEPKRSATDARAPAQAPSSPPAAAEASLSPPVAVGPSSPPVATAEASSPPIDGDDYGGGFDHGEPRPDDADDADDAHDEPMSPTPGVCDDDAGASGKAASIGAGSGHEERDLGLGTSAQGAARSMSEKTYASAVGAGGEDMADEEQRGGAPERLTRTKRRAGDHPDSTSRRSKKARTGHDEASHRPKLCGLQTKKRFVEDDLRLSNSGRGRQKRPKRVIRTFTLPRTHFDRRSAVVKEPNPYDEERLAELFPDRRVLKNPDKSEGSIRREYALDQYYVHKSGDPTHLVPLYRLLDDKTVPSLVVVGLATPLVHSDDPDADPRDRRAPDADVEACEVHLVARWDLRSRPLKFAVEGGPTLASNLADYRLLRPASRSPPPQRRLRRVQPRKGRRLGSPNPFSLPSQSYEPYVATLKRLFNLYVLARTHSLRGNYVEPSSDVDLEGHAEVVKVADEVRRLVELKACTRDSAWQSGIPVAWRSPAKELKLRNHVEEVLLFLSLPDIPFVAPNIYKLVSPYFPLHTFRTENVEQVEREMKDEQRACAQLYAKLRRVVEEHAAFQDDPAESHGRWREKISPEVVNDRALKLEVKTWATATVNGVMYTKGDVVVLEAARFVESAAEDQSDVTSDSASDEDEDAVDAGRRKEGRMQLDKDERPGKGGKDHDSDLWFARVEYFWRERDGDELQVHLRWFTVSRNVPTLGPYGNPRELFALDRCDSTEAVKISGRVEQPRDFCWVKPGEANPRTGFYCGFTYNVDDGSIKDVLTLELETWPRCDALDIVRCSSCETQTAYIDATKPAADESSTRTSKAVRACGDDDALFVLDGITYHRNDTVFVEFRDDDMVTKPRNYALPTGAEASPSAQTPWRLARIVGLHETGEDDPVDDLEDDVVDKIVVEWLVREQELPQAATNVYLSSHEVLVTDETEAVAAVNVCGRFHLTFLDQDDVDLAKTLEELEQSTDNFWTRFRAVSAVIGNPLLTEHGVVTGKAERLPLSPHDLRVCQLCEATRDERATRRKQMRKSRGLNELRLSGGALYSGGGLLDLGLEQGNPLLHTSIAIEKHHVAAECFYANHDGGNIIKQTVSDVNEEVYFGRPSEALQPGELAFLSGGSPCQGFSRLNRFKTLDDLRCAEPFVYLTSLAIFRPLHALYENVAAFETHSIPHPIPGSHDQSFFRLFVAVATSLRYQLRWSVVNAAGYGVPQFRSRIIVQLAASGMRLPDAPSPSHAVKKARARRDHRLLDERDDGAENKGKRSEDSVQDGAPHMPVSIYEAIDDLPAFDFAELFDSQGGYTARPFGVDDNLEDSVPYATAPRTTFQRAVRTVPVIGGSSGGVTHQICKSLSHLVAERVRNIPTGGNHEALVGKPFYPVPPPNVASKSTKLARWWRRCSPGMILAPLRTTLSYDGSSQGERLHYSQRRPLSMRELLRVMGVPDHYELNLPAALGDTDFDEYLRIIGNGVPVPLAAAFGRALHDALEDVVEAHLRGEASGKGKAEAKARKGEVWRIKWAECGGETLRARSGRGAGTLVVEEDDTRRSASAASSSGASSNASVVPQLVWGSDAERAARDDTGRTSLETASAGVAALGARVKAEIELSDSSDEEDFRVEVVRKERSSSEQKRGPCQVLELLDSDSDSD